MTADTPDFSITNVQPSSGNVTALPTTTTTRDPVPERALWMRMWDVVIAKAGGSTADDLNVQSLAQFHCVFDIQLQAQAVIQKATVTVYNPPDDLLYADLTQWADITITGGYQNARYGELFSGKITYFKSGKQNPLETFLEIHAVNADETFTLAVVNHALPAGSTGNDVVNAVLAVLAPYGVTKGQITGLAAQMPRSPRGRTLFGMPMDILRDLAQTLDARVFVDNGQLHMLGPGEQLDGDVIPLNIANGLINIPSQELGGGLSVQCLLHYQIRPGRVIQINNRDVTRVTGGQAWAQDQQVASQLPLTAAIAKTDGKYGVYHVRHHGDNRGQDWYTEIVTNPILPAASIEP